jgi:cysteine dioxygenase
MAGDLKALFAYLDGLDGRPLLTTLRDQVTRLPIACEDVAEFIRFGDERYRRNLVRAGEWYHAWVMCWKNGQRSPIHDHAASCCVVRVLRGTATETTFEFAPNGQIKAVRSRDLPPGSVCVTHDADLHQISNLQAGDADLVTLHVYVPPLVRMKTYSLTEPILAEDVWPEVVSGGAGI